MRLYERMATPCTVMVRREVDDGEGGRTPGPWQAGQRFTAALVLDSASVVDAAGKQGQAQMWTVTTGHRLAFHEVFRRVDDGATFRVTSGLGCAPEAASFGFYQYRAETWEVPHEH